jgi:hypothetical protein
MAIETICKGCARKLRVGDEYAGRKARCPHCKTVYTVPGIEGEESNEPTFDTSDNWLLRTKDGTVYGPVGKPELDDWMREGRLDSASQVRREAEQVWQPASEFYPSLAPAVGSRANPFASDSTVPVQAANPYSSPRSAGPLSRSFRPHRGGVILALSLLGFICCQLFSIAAWVMGHADMKEINAGRMDPEGRGLTQAGMIIGIIGTVLLVFVVGVQLLIGVFAIVN